jgi:hypothetical protein
LEKFLKKPTKEKIMHIKIEENGPVVKDLPAGNEVLFFAKINNKRGYGVVYGPSDTCLPTEGSVELWDACVAFGQLDTEMEVHEVKHGHKYEQGGGFIETKSHGQIFFRRPGNDKQSSYEGDPIEEVYIAL